MSDYVTDAASLIQVILIDLALSADNAVAVGLAAAALKQPQRDRAVRWGIALALLLRVLFGFATVEMLHIRGLLAIGGVLLLWIAVRMWLDIRRHHRHHDDTHPDERHTAPSPVSFGRALFSIVVANFALSLDNVLAVAGVSRHSPWIMAFGLVLSVLLMGVAAALIARVVDRHRWIAHLGILIIVVAGMVMIWDDAHLFFPAYIQEPPPWLGGAET